MAIILFTMPTSSIALLFSLAVGLTNAIPGAEPAIETFVYRADEWSPRPTGVPEKSLRLFKRESMDIALCGWQGGDKAKPAKCDSGSFCIHDTIHGFVGCCTTDGPCTQGVYTTCLDSKTSGWLAAPTLVNDGVTMCPENSQCYKNTYPGQYFQYSCGDPASATTISTAYIGQPSDMRLQVVFTGVTFNPTARATGGGSTTIAATATVLATGAGSVGGVSPASAAKTSAQPPTASKANAGTVAGGTVAGLAGVALIGALVFFCLRRRNKTNKTRRSGSAFLERKDPFGQHEPVHQNYNPDEFFSPLTGSNNARGFDVALDNDTAYHGGGGMTGSHHGSVHVSHRPMPSFSTIAAGNPYVDEEPAPSLPTGPHRYTDVSRHNPFSDHHTYKSAPKPLSERAYSTLSNRNTPSPPPATPAQEQTMLLVTEIDNEIDDFSRAWSEGSHKHNSDRDNSDDDSEGGHQLQTAKSVAIPYGRSTDREAQSRALRQMVHQHSQTPDLRTVRSDISSLHNGGTDQQSRNITAPVPVQYQTHAASNSPVSSLPDTPTPAMQAAAISRLAHPLEQEQNLLDEPTTSRDRLDSEDTTYSEDLNYSRHSFPRSSLRPIPPPVKNERISFGLTGAISEAISGSDGWRGSGIDGQEWSPAWSGIGGGWLEGQSGMAMTTVEKNKETAAGPHELPDTAVKRSSVTQKANRIMRRPVGGVPILNSPGLLQTERGSERMRKGTFGVLHENKE